MGKTKKKSLISKQKPINIINVLMNILNNVKMFHWKTTSYSIHKATDDLYHKLNEYIDEFTEILLGKKRNINVKRGNVLDYGIINLEDYSLEKFKYHIEEHKQILIKLPSNSMIKMDEDSDLLNLKDEILGLLNKFTYLLTLK